jgi:hypothetical protein
MAVTMRGFGDISQRLAGNKLRPIRSAGLTLSSETESEQINGYPIGAIGPQSLITTVVQSKTFTMTVESGDLQDNAFSIVFNQNLVTAASTPIVAQQVLSVPTATPWEVAVAGLTENQNVAATVLTTSNGAPLDVYLTRVAASAELTTGQFKVEAGKLVFHSTIADVVGAQGIFINYQTTATSLPVIGGPTALSPIGSFEVFAKMQTTSGSKIWNFWAPNAQVGEDIEFGSEIDNLSLEFTLGTVAGWALPFMLWQPV